MASKIKVDQIEGSTASTVSLPSGQTLDLSSGSITLPDSAVDLSSAKVTGILGTGNLPNIPEANLPTIPVSKGGTGVTSLGSAGQVIKVNSGGTALEFGTGGGIGNIYQVTYKDSTSYSGAGRTNSDVVTGLNATFTRQSQTSKTLLSYSLHVGSTDDCWILFKIQYSTDGSSFTDVPDISNQYNASVPRGHFGNANRGGGSNGSDYETSNVAYEYLHDTSAIASSTIYYRIILFKGHGSTSGCTIYINRSSNMGTDDPNRNTYPSNFLMKEIL
jgi:hypothetical protein